MIQQKWVKSLKSGNYSTELDRKKTKLLKLKLFVYYSNYSNSQVRIALFGIRIRSFFKNRIYSVFGIRCILKIRIYSVFGIRSNFTIRPNTDASLCNCMQAHRSACILEHSGTFCMHSGTFCIHSGTFCMHSGTFCMCSGIFCMDSGTFCMLSGTFCMHSVTFWNILHAFWNIL